VINKGLIAIADEYIFVDGTIFSNQVLKDPAASDTVRK